MKRNINIMKILNLKLLISITAFALGLSLNAQTIYHYKCVARVDPSTGVKERYNGRGNLHLIYDGNSVIWEVTEEGDKISLSRKAVQSPGVKTEYKILGEDYKRYTYQSVNNNIRIYRCIDEYKLVMYSSGMEMTMSGPTYVNRETVVSSDRTVNYLYTSSDRQKVNWRTETSNIFVYELYDTDEKGYSRPQYQNDPSKPTTLY